MELFFRKYSFSKFMRVAGTPSLESYTAALVNAGLSGSLIALNSFLSSRRVLLRLLVVAPLRRALSLPMVDCWVFLLSSRGDPREYVLKQSPPPSDDFDWSMMLHKLFRGSAPWKLIFVFNICLFPLGSAPPFSGVL